LLGGIMMNTFKTRYKLMRNHKNKSASFSLTSNQSFMIKLYAQLFLDELCYEFNKKRLTDSIDHAIDRSDQKKFSELSKAYQKLIQTNS
jgi:uncharacterized protein YpiB (UPF0302 family)